MDDVERLARSAVGTVTVIVRKAWRFSWLLVIGVSVVCVGSLLLGLAALSGGIRVVWAVLAIGFAAIAIGGPLLTLWQIGGVKRHADDLIDDVTALVRSGSPAERTVIETFDADDPNRPAEERGAIQLTRQVSSLRGVATGVSGGSARLGAAVATLARLPFVAIASLLITSVFGFLALMFLIALAI